MNCVTKNQPCVKRNRINVTKKVLTDDICFISPIIPVKNPAHH